VASTIADYALIGNCETAALVARNGSIDWLCWPRFDSPACFAALLGTNGNGYWRLSPAELTHPKRQYRPHSLILETRFHTDEGRVTVIDFMPVRESVPRIIRMVRGDRGAVRMRMELCLRFNYGRRRPSLQHDGECFQATTGSDRISILSSIPLLVEKKNDVVATFTVKSGETVVFELAARRSRESRNLRNTANSALNKTQRFWTRWASRLKYRGPHWEEVERSLLTLKALTYAHSGGIIAAPTTSLPEAPGGRRNWDYRYCWLRDATFTLLGFIHTGYRSEAQRWKRWLLSSVAKRPDQLRIMYDVTGKIVPEERRIPWLPGYRGALPVRVGNAASKQVQLDVFGEVSDALYQAGLSRAGHQPLVKLLVKLLDHLKKTWRRPDHGIWETRKTERQFTHSKVMCWVAFDRAVRAAEEFGFRAPTQEWRVVRQEIHDDVCSRGFSLRKGSFVKAYGSAAVDASLLLLPLVGFLPPKDRRIVGTVRLIEKTLVHEGFVKRSRHSREGAFLPCTLWLADYYELIGRRQTAARLLKRLLRIRNDVGLLSEEYDIREKRLVGNFPQALAHVALVNTIINLHRRFGPSLQRSSPNRRGVFL
jgi:GH15 family glucan-1,4-alpha-glucosidase